MASFDMNQHFLSVRPENFSEVFPIYQMPLEIGKFSIDGERRFFNDDREKKYLIQLTHVSPYRHMDLSRGYSMAVHKDFFDSTVLDSALRWIMENKATVIKTFPTDVQSKNRFQVDFVCYRGLLTLLICTPYESQEDWKICATKFKGVIYLYSFPTERCIREKENTTERQKLMCYWGYKFEQYMTAKSTDCAPDTEAILNECEEYCVMMKAKLGPFKILFGGEVDAVDTGLFSEGQAVSNYCELKTSRILTSQRQYENFCRYKLLKWWAQSFLIGISRIICGFRDDDGIIRDIKSYAVTDLPTMSKKHWKPSIGMNFCKTFLEFVKSVVTKDDPHIIYRFDYQPGKKVTVEEEPVPSQFQILPEWYISAVH